VPNKVTIKQYIETHYAQGSRPTARTIFRRLKKGQILHPWTKEGQRVYIDTSITLTGNPLVDRLIDRVLNA